MMRANLTSATPPPDGGVHIGRSHGAWQESQASERVRRPDATTPSMSRKSLTNPPSSDAR